MTTSHTMQVGGVSANTLAEVEAASHAMRGVTYPEVDFSGNGGVYSASLSWVICNSNTTGKSWTNAPIASMRNGLSGNIIRLKRLTWSFGLVAVPTAGVWTIQLFKALLASQYPAQTNGTTFGTNGPYPVSPTQLRGVMSYPSRTDLKNDSTNQGLSSIGTDIVIAKSDTADGGSAGGAAGMQLALNAAAVSVAWIRAETNPLASVSISAVATAGRHPGDSVSHAGDVESIRLWDWTQGDAPIELLTGEGVILKMTTAALAATDTTATVALSYIYESIPVTVS